jgi:hypothetical protein
VFLNLIDHDSFCNFQLIIIDADATENTAPDAPIIGCELAKKYKPELKIPESIKYFQNSFLPKTLSTSGPTIRSINILDTTCIKSACAKICVTN